MSTLKQRVNRMISGSDREKNLETQIKILADRLALALLSQHEVMQAVVLLDGRGEDRETLREDPQYPECLRMVRRMLVTEMQRRRAEDKAA